MITGDASSTWRLATKSNYLLTPCFSKQSARELEDLGHFTKEIFNYIPKLQGGRGFTHPIKQIW